MPNSQLGHKARRIEQAATRQIERDKRTSSQQVRILMDRPGDSFREQSRLSS